MKAAYSLQFVSCYRKKIYLFYNVFSMTLKRILRMGDQGNY